jgi:hypothetical protein
MEKQLRDAQLPVMALHAKKDRFAFCDVGNDDEQRRASGTTTVRARQSDGRGRRALPRPLVSRAAFTPVGSSDARLV